jgi:pyruvate kinase
MPIERGKRALVVTLGPASFAQAAELAQAGATALRLNASHMTAAEVRSLVQGLSQGAGGCPVVVDLQGAKMRLGLFAERSVAAGERIVLACGTATPENVPVPHAELFEQVRAGETLSIDDGRLRFAILERGAGRLAARALTAGVLRPRKGVNVVEHPVALDDLSEPDAAVMEALSTVAHVAWAISFLVDGRETAWVRRRLPGARVIGKIERREAVENVGAVAAATDEIWICRGDLGAQIGAAALARFVARFDPRPCGRPVLMAGQVLEHLTQHADPTRSEVCHLHDLLARGYAGIVLSDETAIGADPLRATLLAAELLAELGS